MKSKGFLLAEAVFSIFITMIVILILRNLLMNLRTANHVKHQSDELAYAYVQLDKFLHDGDVVYTLPELTSYKKAAFRKKDGKDSNIYVITQYESMIRIRTPSAGHMPLLLNVEDAKFHTDEDQIKIDIKEKDGRKSELVFKFDQKESDYEDEKKKSKKDERQRTAE